jgi:cytosine/adenosine deaminase-related metal-dependent hydrolase
MAQRKLLRGGTVIPVKGGDLPAEFVGDVLIEDGKIAAIAPRLDVAPEHAEVVDMTDHIVLPGFVDTHRHMWQSIFRYAGTDWVLADYANAMWRILGPIFEPEDTYLSLRVGLAEALNAGVTQVYDWNHNLNSPDHADAAVAAHRDSGARVVLGYGQSSQTWAQILDPAIGASVEPPSADIVRLRNQYYASDAQLLTLGMAARGPECSPMHIVEQEARLAAELGLRSCVHVGNGSWGHMGPIRMMLDAGCDGSTVTWVHCNSVSDSEFDLIRDTGGSVSSATELEQHMGHGHPAIERCIIRGIRPALSVDTCVNVSGDLFSIMRAALSSVRGDIHQRRIERGGDSESMPATTHDVLEFATLSGALANGLGDVTGTLEVGKQADIIAIDCLAPNLMPMTYAAGSVVMGAHPGNVAAVLVAGEFVKRDGKLVDIDLKDLAASAVATRDRLFDRVGAHVGGWMPPRTERDWQATPQ